MTETPKEILVELPPALEEIVYGFERLSLTPAPRPPHSLPSLCMTKTKPKNKNPLDLPTFPKLMPL